MRKAFHLRGGEYEAVRLIDAWLARHGYEVAGCHDVFDACAQMISRQSQPTEFVFLGTDWLEPDDSALIDYARLVWPSSGIVLYGEHAELPQCHAAGLVACCDSRAALQRLLGQNPDELVRHLRVSAQARAGTETRRDTAPAADPEPQIVASELAPLQDVSPMERDARGAALEGEPPHAVLTRAELAALLGED